MAHLLTSTANTACTVQSFKQPRTNIVVVLNCVVVLARISETLLTNNFTLLYKGVAIHADFHTSFQGRVSIKDANGSLPTAPTMSKKQFSISLSGHVADLIGFLTQDTSLIWLRVCHRILFKLTYNVT